MKMTPFEKAEAIVKGWVGTCSQETMINGEETLIELIADAIELEQRRKSQCETKTP